ncbi:MAG TPA: hypothetical protein VH331_11210 [Allosphingosinicella sp.]|jgi:hypothetical protein|nr:hypothetical protein [Allosphingosinicella sp.]
MNNRRRAGALGAAAAMAATSGSVLVRHESVAGAMSDFWLGTIAGAAIGLLIVAVLVIRRGGRRSACD